MPEQLHVSGQSGGQRSQGHRLDYCIIDILSGITLPARSTVLICSASSIVVKGIQTYCKDMDWSIRVLREKLGDRVSVCPCPDPSLVRGVAEADAGLKAWWDLMEHS